MITLHNTTKDSFIKQSTQAFSFINGSKVKSSKVRQALVMQFGLQNEHLIDSLFAGPSYSVKPTITTNNESKQTVNEIEVQTLFGAIHDDTETYEDEIAAYRMLCSSLIKKLGRAELDALLTDTFDLDGDDADFYFENGNKVKNFVTHSPAKVKLKEQEITFLKNTPVMCTFEEDNSDHSVTFDAQSYFQELLQEGNGDGAGENVAKSFNNLSECIEKLRECNYTADYATDDIAYWAEMKYDEYSAIRQAVFKSNGFCVTVSESDLQFWLAIYAPELINA